MALGMNNAGILLVAVVFGFSRNLIGYEGSVLYQQNFEE